MGFNLEEIKANLNFGGARPTLFECIVATRYGNLAGGNKFRFTCKAASLPASEINTIDLFSKGRPIKLAGDRPAFPDWEVTVYNDEDFSVRNTFEEWLSAMNEHEGNIIGRGVTANPNSYKSDAYVTQYGKAGNILKQIKFYGLFPRSLGPIGLDWDNANQIETFTVSMAFDYWGASGGTTDIGA